MLLPDCHYRLQDPDGTDGRPCLVYEIGRVTRLIYKFRFEISTCMQLQATEDFTILCRNIAKDDEG